MHPTELLKTLFLLEHLPELPILLAAQLLVLGLVFKRAWNRSPPGAPHGGPGNTSKRVTQSISLSNIHAFVFVEKAGPEAVETC